MIVPVAIGNSNNRVAERADGPWRDVGDLSVEEEEETLQLRMSDLSSRSLSVYDDDDSKLSTLKRYFHKEGIGCECASIAVII